LVDAVPNVINIVYANIHKLPNKFWDSLKSNCRIPFKIVGDINHPISNSNSGIINAEIFIRLAPQVATLPNIVVGFYLYMRF
jgi:hypothetical protein